MDVAAAWGSGANFRDILKMIQVFEVNYRRENYKPYQAPSVGTRVGPESTLNVYIIDWRLLQTTMSCRSKLSFSVPC
eukprot:scaffold430491_cov19-Prasinocladus_malaysianus.AAC.1